MCYSHRHHWIGIVVLAASLGACHSWRAEGVAPSAVITEKKPSSVRITKTDSSRVEMYNPAISGDSLVGTTLGPGGQSHVPYAVPLSDVAYVSTGHTNYLPVVIIGAVLLVAGAVAASSASTFSFR
jgi:hypothetical protein